MGEEDRQSLDLSGPGCGVFCGTCTDWKRAVGHRVSNTTNFGGGSVDSKRSIEDPFTHYRRSVRRKDREGGDRIE